MARYNTTVTKKDGSKVSGYIEDGKSYYDDGTSISAGDSVVDAQGKTWTKGGDTSASSEVAMISNAIAQNNAGIKNAINTAKAKKQSEYTVGDNISALADLQKQMKQQELQRARASALSSLNAEEQATNQAYKTQIDQTGTNADIQLKNYFENVANRGQTNSGSTNQAEIAFNIANKNNINALQTAQANALADIARRKQLAEQGYIDDLQKATNEIDLKVLENRIAQEQADKEALAKAQEAQYEQELNKAKLAAQYGDYSLLEGLTGMDSTYAKKMQETEMAELSRKAEQEQTEQALNKAKLMAQVGDFSGLKALGYDTTALEKQWNADINNTYSLISQRNNETKKTTEDNSKNYNEMLDYIREITPSLGNSYEENMKASRELLYSGLSNSDMINIMKRTNVRPEAFVKLLVDEGYPQKQIEAFIELYTDKQEYRDSLIKYAYQ